MLRQVCYPACKKLLLQCLKIPCCISGRSKNHNIGEAKLLLKMWPQLHSNLAPIFYASTSDRYRQRQLLWVCLSASVCIHLCMSLGMCLGKLLGKPVSTNQWKEFHQTLVDDAVQLPFLHYIKLDFEGEGVKVKVTTRSNVKIRDPIYLLYSLKDHCQIWGQRQGQGCYKIKYSCELFWRAEASTPMLKLRSIT